MRGMQPLDSSSSVSNMIVSQRLKRVIWKVRSDTLQGMFGGLQLTGAIRSSPSWKCQALASVQTKVDMRNVKCRNSFLSYF